MQDTERREAAIARLKEKRDFWTHLFVYFAVNILLVVVWVVTADGGYFWPVWPIAGWGIGLTVHAFETFRRPIREDAIRREMERSKS
ncbi:MAG: 2TM domain-containing protein [Actinomycetota bacterium]